MQTVSIWYSCITRTQEDILWLSEKHIMYSVSCVLKTPHCGPERGASKRGLLQMCSLSQISSRFHPIGSGNWTAVVYTVDEVLHRYSISRMAMLQSTTPASAFKTQEENLCQLFHKL